MNDKNLLCNNYNFPILKYKENDIMQKLIFKEIKSKISQRMNNYGWDEPFRVENFSFRDSNFKISLKLSHIHLLSRNEFAVPRSKSNSDLVLPFLFLCLQKISNN